MFLLMSYAGLRVSELHRLNIADFNRSTNTLQVFGKGRKWRVIPLPAELVKVLNKALMERMDSKELGGAAFFCFSIWSANKCSNDSNDCREAFRGTEEAVCRTTREVDLKS